MRNSVFCSAVVIVASQFIVQSAIASVQLGPRPFFLVDKMNEGPLKDTLQQCAAEIQVYEQDDFSIGHRGASLQFPEHTKESYRAAGIQGAGIIECDVTFTSDGELVCRHAQSDLHTTTNILSLPLADTCNTPFQPATFDNAGNMLSAASASCSASDLTLAEFKSMAGKMDAANSKAATVNEYMGGTADFRTDLYATGAMLLSHRESIDVIRAVGGKFTPELKSAPAGFGDSGLNQQDYARKMIQEYIDAGVYSENVWPQSFNLDDVLLWIEEYPDYGEQAVWLDGRDPADMATNPPSVEDFMSLKNQGVNIIAPPIPVLLTTDEYNQIVPSTYAVNARAAGLEIISWSLERSGRLVQDVLQGGGTYYYQSILDTIQSDGQVYEIIDVLAQDVGVIGMFSDWPATTTFYANCMKHVGM